MTASRIIPFVLLVISAPACILSPDIVGETLTKGQLATSDTTDSGAATDSGATTTAGDSSISATTEVQLTEGSQLVYGEPCEFGPAEVWEETSAPPDPNEKFEPVVSVLSSTDLCQSGMCLLVYDDEPAVNACAGDDDCANPDRRCSDDGKCVLTDTYVAAHAYCTQTCEVEADCPAVDGCEQGLACVPIARLGPNCCKKVCACKDKLSVGQTDMTTAECAKGLEWCQ